METGRVGRKLLYVDALNLFNFFTSVGGTWSILGKARKSMKDFRQTATKSGWQIKCFIDAGTGTEGGALKTWKSRRNLELAKGRKNVPQASAVLLGDVFRSLGSEVFYSSRFDNDDTIAFMAQKDGAHVLSGDKDFYRYMQRQFDVYHDYELLEGCFLLSKRDPWEVFPKKAVIMRKIQVIDEILDCRAMDPAMVSLDKNLYLRGCPCPLVRYLGNAHHRVRPLRQALYFRFSKERIREIYPCGWNADSQEAIWMDEQVVAVENDKLFQTHPEALVAEYFGDEVRPLQVSDADWYNHQFACHAIVWELWLMGQNPRRDVNELLKVMEQFERDHRHKHTSGSNDAMTTNAAINDLTVNVANVNLGKRS